MQILISCSNDQEFCFYIHHSLFLQVQPKFLHYQILKTDVVLMNLTEYSETCQNSRVQLTIKCLWF
ncbi:unnamed protein product, partial [Vitis vinifera]|uniref:Uncharacterized protein n=1 Tax=Vitis vinifera TaxID=29760 RepID=D7UBQ2_VITVI